MIINSDSASEQFIIGSYIYRFNGENVTEIYDKNDLGFEKNLINTVKNPETERGKILSKAWYQDYMYRVINRKLN
jgi:hypothetical protein